MFDSVLKSLREERGLSQKELADALGTSKSTIGMYEQGKRTPKSEKMSEIATYFGVTTDYLMGRTSHSSLNEINFSKLGISKIITHKIPVLGKIACGKPIMCEEEYETQYDANSDINADFCLKASGDSMINARIFDGDIVFIRQQDIVENGEIAAVIVNDEEVTLKRFYYDPEAKSVTLTPENPIYKPMFFSGDDLSHIRVLGKVVGFSSMKI